MRIKNSEHAATAWRVQEIAPDFELHDAWQLPAAGGPNDFETFLRVWRGLELGQTSGSGASGFLFRLRERLGRWFGWDDETNTLPIPGCTERSLCERLPADLPAIAERGPGPFLPVFQTEDEFAAEISNGTVHAILQLGWRARPDGTYGGSLGVYVKTRGWFGRVYMAAIAPFRHLIVYPALLRRVDRAWARRKAAT
ncbi:MAG: DUF2867 domain-containing protein [Myxococcota bacterium]